ncbi:MAG: hypothetical protein WKG07_06675 [Hymenobacter sp.]
MLRLRQGRRRGAVRDGRGGHQLRGGLKYLAKVRHHHSARKKKRPSSRLGAERAGLAVHRFGLGQKPLPPPAAELRRGHEHRLRLPQGRGLNLSTIQTFELGYSLDSWDDLMKSRRAAGYDKKYPGENRPDRHQNRRPGQGHRPPLRPVSGPA